MPICWFRRPIALQRWRTAIQCVSHDQAGCCAPFARPVLAFRRSRPELPLPKKRDTKTVGYFLNIQLFNEPCVFLNKLEPHLGFLAHQTLYEIAGFAGFVVVDRYAD